MNDIAWRKWTWVIYPLFAGLVILSSVKYLTGSGQGNLSQLFERQKKVESQSDKATRLRAKLAQLKELDTNLAIEDLSLMVKAVPPAKRAWLTGSELSTAGLELGIDLEEYKGEGGEVKEASESAKNNFADKDMVLQAAFTVNDISQLAQLLEKLETKMPLMKIRTVDFGRGGAEIKVEGAWAQWSKIPAESELLTLPEYKSTVSEMRSILRLFSSLPETVPYSGESQDITNPF